MTTDTGGDFPYHSAQAFGSALTSQFKRLAADSRYSVSQLRRQFAYDRLLARLFATEDQRWILKGGVSMLARLSLARHSADIDLCAQADSPQAALAALHDAASHDLGDFFTFHLQQPRSLIQGIQGIRIPTEARLGPRLFERFSLDLVTGTTITAPPEIAAPVVPLDIPGLIRPSYRLYPLVDAVADKVMAITEHHQNRPSTSFRDLVDLVLIAHDQTLDAAALAAALNSEHLRRGVPLPAELTITVPALWRPGYARTAADTPELAEATLDQALNTARRLLDPILSGHRTTGTWNQHTLTWR